MFPASNPSFTQSRHVLIILPIINEHSYLLTPAHQNPDDSPTPEALAEMGTRTEGLRDETTTLNATTKSLRNELAQLNSSLSTADLRTSVASMEEEKAEITARLERLRSGSVKPVSVEEKEKVDRELKLCERVVLSRKRIVKEMWGGVLECLPEGTNVEDMKVCDDLGCISSWYYADVPQEDLGIEI